MHEKKTLKVPQQMYLRIIGGNQMYKKCMACGVSKPVSNFRKSNKTKDGYVNRCNDCIKPTGRPKSEGVVTTFQGRKSDDGRWVREVYTPILTDRPLFWQTYEKVTGRARQFWLDYVEQHYQTICLEDAVPDMLTPPLGFIPLLFEFQ